MKSFGTAVLAVTLFIVSWSIFSGLLTVASLSLGGTATAAGKAVAYIAFVVGTMAAGVVTVYVTGRMVKELSSLRVWGSFSVAAVVVSAFFTTPWYVVDDGIGHGTPEALLAVLVGVPLAIIGGYGGRLWIRARRQAELAALNAEAASPEEQSMAEALADAALGSEVPPNDAASQNGDGPGR